MGKFNYRLLAVLVNVGLTALCIGALVTGQSAQGQTFTVLHSFAYSDGASPMSGVTIDSSGNNLYGTASLGGTHNFGTVYRVHRSGPGWVFAPLYSFQGDSDGYEPHARVIVGPDGSLYGTTARGGGSCSCGTVFKLRPSPNPPVSASSPWHETILYRFTGADGDYPLSEVAFDRAGNLFGTTMRGGSYDSGTAYKLAPSNGNWTENLVHTFGGSGDGYYPASGIAIDTSGDLYGTAPNGSPYGQGVVYALTPSGGSWIYNIRYEFRDGNDGAGPVGGLIFDGSGNLFGETSVGGTGNGGTLFELAPPGWTFTLLYALPGNGAPGPQASLAMDASGNLYGTTPINGAYGEGSVFKLTYSGDGWTYSTLHDFTGGSDGCRPSSVVTLDSSGSLYGTTETCGINNDGVVWKITP